MGRVDDVACDGCEQDRPYLGGGLSGSYLRYWWVYAEHGGAVHSRATAFHRLGEPDLSGETEKDISGWTTDTLRMHYDQVHQEMNARRDGIHREMNLRINTVAKEMDLRYQQRFDASEKALGAALTSAEKAVEAALKAAEKAVLKSERAAEDRFDSVNEFRAQLADQARTFATRTEFLAAQTYLKERVDALQTSIDQASGSASHQRVQVSNVVALCAIIGMIVSVLALVLSR